MSTIFFQSSMCQTLSRCRIREWLDTDLAPAPLTIFRSNSKLDQSLKWSGWKMQSTDHNEILHTSRQCDCHNVCKNSLWSIDDGLNYSAPNFDRISNSIEIPQVSGTGAWRLLHGPSMVAVGLPVGYEMVGEIAPDHPLRLIGLNIGWACFVSWNTVGSRGQREFPPFSEFTDSSL